MAEYECGVSEDTTLEIQAVIDLVDANVAPLDTTTEWRRALAFAEGEIREELSPEPVITPIIDAQA